MKKPFTIHSSLFITFIILLIGLSSSLKAQIITENFDDISKLTDNGWSLSNKSNPLGTTGWMQGGGTFNAYNGSANSYISANVYNVLNTGQINNFLLTPNRTFRNGDVITFYTRKTSPDEYPDRLEVRLSTNGASTNVGSTGNGFGDFATLLLSINTTLTTGIYPTTWTQYTITISGLPAPTSGRLAFRYFVTSAGVTNTNGEFIGIDNFAYTPYVCPTFTISPTSLTTNGIAGTSYSASLSQTGALGPPSFGITAGALPPGLVLSSTGKISGTPTATGTFNFTVTASDASGCSGSAPYSITVICPANPIIFSLSDICSNAEPFTLTGGSPEGGFYSGTGVLDGKFNPTAGTQSITYDYIDPYGCSHSSSATFTVNSAPPVKAAALDAVCKGNADITLNSGSPLGGTYSGTNVTSGVFIPTTAGTTTITYSYTDANGCTASASSDINVYDIPNVTAAALTDVCQETKEINLDFGSPAGGTYSGTNVTSGVFTPTTAGTTTITYSYTDANGCTASASSDINVYHLPNVTAAALTDVCQETKEINLDFGSPAGGTYSGTNVTSGVFTPTTAGTTTITYSYTDANGCTASASSDINVYHLPNVTAAALTDVCLETTEINLNFGSPAGGTYSGTNVTSGVFTPTTAGTTTITYSYTDANGCTASASSDINVYHLPNVTAAALTDVCLETTEINLNFGSPAGGTYSGTNVTSGVFTPTTAGTTTITYSYTDANGCTASASSDINVDICTGITNSSMAGIKCYPNPSTGIVIVEFEQKNGVEVLAQIIDSYGQIVIENKQSTQTSSYSQTFDLSNYPKGMYTVSLHSENKITYYKLIVQ
ncbi:MAG: choice-of-anchor J domain-containing protein [Sporocytophaga sp.]|nr:choice-of-anchor J domain-containing protein [Sporocytophaga sp.]